MIEYVYKSIREIRLQKGFTQDYMAKKLDITQNNYGKLERGLIQLTIERLWQIADEFRMSPLHILTYHNEITQTGGLPSLTTTDDENYVKIRQMTEEIKLLTEKNSTLAGRIDLESEQKEFRIEQIQTLMAFIKSIVNLLPQIRRTTETPEEEAKVYLDYLFKINYTTERIFAKFKD
jgi:transcriptional regulator with XRE-family HTH domain